MRDSKEIKIEVNGGISPPEAGAEIERALDKTQEQETKQKPKQDEYEYRHGLLKKKRRKR